MGVCTAVGVAPGTNVMFIGFPSMVCNGWCGHVLNALELKYSMIHFSITRLFACVGWKGIFSGFGGTDVLHGHPHGAFFFSLAKKLFFDKEEGKFAGNSFKSFKAVCDR